MSTKRLRLCVAKTEAVEADDLLTEIMLRLPSNSINRFKLLCKQWYILATSSSFRKLWLARNYKPASGLILESSYSTQRCFIPLSSNVSKAISSSSVPTEFIIEQSCNGLFLCRTGSYFGDLVFHVYNPTMNKSARIPKLEGETCPMTLANDPVISPYYKVVASTVLRERGNVLIQIHVYSSRTGRWTSVLEPRPKTYLNKGIYWNGSIIWIEPLLYFNIEDQTLKQMPAPPDHIWSMYNYLGVSCGRLNYATVGRSTPCFVDVYELKRDYSQWVLKYHVSIENCNYEWKVLSVVHGLEEDSFLVLRISAKIVRFNLVSKTSKELSVLEPSAFAPIPSTYAPIRALQYVESLCGV